MLQGDVTFMESSFKFYKWTQDKIISGVLTIILLLTLLISDNYLPVGLTRTKVANLLTFFMSACMFGGFDAQTPQLYAG